MLQSIDTVIAFVVIMTVTSLFVTILVQMFSAALSLRGKNLANALALTFQTISPSLDRQAHQLAARILSDPLLSDSTRTDKDKRLNAGSAAGARTKPWHFTDVFCGAARLASAVRPEEVYASLKRLAAGADTAPPPGGSRRRKENDSPQHGSIQQAANTILESLAVARHGEGAEKSERAALLEEIHGIGSAPIRDELLSQLAERGSRAVSEIDLARAKFDAWFGSAQNRAQQWFQLHTRGLTIAASALIALFLQLDAIEIFHRLSTDSAARSALVARADRLLNEAGPAADEKGGLIQRAADAWAQQTGQRVDLAGVNQIEQLRNLLASRSGFDAAAFEETVQQVQKEYYRDQRAKLSELTSHVSATGFELIPASYWRWSSAPDLPARLTTIAKHLPGILLFTGLLTLGAPYWYNLLKNLTNLRPALAQVIAQEEKRDAGRPK